MVRFCKRHGKILEECDTGKAEKLGIEFAIHKVGRTDSIHVVLLCYTDFLGFGIHFRNPVLHVHNIYGGNAFLTGEL